VIKKPACDQTTFSEIGQYYSFKFTYLQFMLIKIM